MVPAGNKAKCLSSVNHTTQTIHYHYQALLNFLTILSQSILIYFNRDLYRSCLVYMFSLRFSGSKFLINLRRQFRVRKIFHTQVFAGFAVFSFCV